MLNQKKLRSLGYMGKYDHELSSASFKQDHQQIWTKQKNIPFSAVPKTKKHFFSFYKYGKTLGFETKRYIEYKDGLIFYFEGQYDQEYKGYCRVHNLYIYYLKVGMENSTNLLCLCNGLDFEELYFNDNAFFQSVSAELLRNAIQVNFNEKYKLEETIGKGSFAKVYLGLNRNTEKYAAIKIISKISKEGTETKEIVEIEKSILNAIDSKYVCKMEEFYEKDEDFIFVLEYLPGKNLMEHFRAKSSFTLKWVRNILRSVLLGLEAIHEKNIIHRDIKPQNVVVDEASETAKIIDFGLAMKIEKKSSLDSYRKCGTVGYMAPEVIKSTPENREIYTTKCDLFSVGIIAHMMLLQNNPLKGSNYKEAFNKNLECTIDLDEKKILKKHGKQCYQFLLKLLEKNPNKRWSATEALGSEFMQRSFEDQQKVLTTQAQIESPQRIYEPVYTPVIKLNQVQSKRKALK